MFEIWRRFQKWNKTLSKIFGFSDNYIWIGSCKFPHYWTGYLQSAVNMSKKTPKISTNTRGDIFPINFLQNDEKILQSCSNGDFASIWGTFTCWLSKRFLKQPFLDSALTKIFTVCNFGNTLATTIILFFKECLKFHVDSINGRKHSEKVFRFWDNCVSIGNCKFSQYWTRYLPSAVNVLRSIPKIWLNSTGDIFWINISQNDQKNMRKELSWRFRKYLAHFHMLTVKACSETTLFTGLSDIAFHSL